MTEDVIKLAKPKYLLGPIGNRSQAQENLYDQYLLLNIFPKQSTSVVS